MPSAAVTRCIVASLAARSLSLAQDGQSYGPTGPNCQPHKSGNSNSCCTSRVPTMSFLLDAVRNRLFFFDVYPGVGQ
jgi:hypothetical protein